MPHRVRHQLRRRYFDIDYRRVHVHPIREAVRLLAQRAGWNSVVRPGGLASVDWVYRDFDRHVARTIASMRRPHRVQTVYAYEDAAECTFEAAAATGKARVYELPIAYWRTVQRILRDEAERLPAWRRTIHGLADSATKLERKDHELDLADVIVVPSRFVLESLPDSIRARKRLVLAPFGSPAPRHVDHENRRRPNGPLRLLFAGAMTQRKGLGDLFAAMRLLDRRDIELVVLGALNAPIEFYRSQYAHFTYVGTRPHAEVLDVMRSCDVLALPSLAEGRALVQQEALACGLPLIVTANAGADDLIDEGRTGFLVPIRSPEAIAERIAWIADHRDALADMRHHTIRKALETGWEHYERRVVDAVRETCEMPARRCSDEAA
jgi:glycosyltransferase involved in cell wall biosynthesis